MLTLIALSKATDTQYRTAQIIAWAFIVDITALIIGLWFS